MKSKLVLYLLIATSVVFGQGSDLNFYKINYGELRAFNHARSLSLGNSGIAGGHALHAAALNPALLIKTEHDVAGSISGMIFQSQEDRSFPYYDNFGGFVDYGSYVFNSNWYRDAAMSGVVRFTPTAGQQFVASLGVTSFLDFNYDYVEEVRTTGFSDDILAFNKLRSEGIIREIGLDLATKPVADLTLGLHAGLLLGEITQKSEIDSVSPSVQNIRQVETNTMDIDNTPLLIRFGALYQVDEKLTLGAAIRLPVEIEFSNRYQLQTQDVTLARTIDAFGIVDNVFAAGGSFDSSSTTSFNRSVTYPASVGAGLEYRFTNLLEARINVDFEYTFWSDIEDDRNPGARFDDTYALRFGVEHIFFNKMPFRLGFSYQPLRENKAQTRTMLTAGIGLIYDNFQIDLAGGVRSLTFNQRDMFDDGRYATLDSRADPIDQVESDDFFGAFEIQYFFDFAK